MRRALGLAVVIAGALSAVPGTIVRADLALPVQDPQIQNGRVERRQATAVDREMAAVGQGAEAVWIGWQVPMTSGDRDLCNWYSNDSTTVRGFLANAGDMSGPPQIAPATSPVPLEAGSGLVVLVRMTAGQVDRIRSLRDDCPIDAGGRTVYWLDGITPQNSMAWLSQQTAVPVSTVLERMTVDRGRSIATSALSAIALHAAAGADAMLEQAASATNPDASLRRHAASRLASDRGAAGFAMLQRLIAAESEAAMRRSLVSSLGQTRQPGTPGALLALARNDADARTRGEAASRYLRLAGSDGIANVMALMTPDADDAVVSRVVSGLGSLPDDAGVASIVTIARSGAGQSVRRSAISTLGRGESRIATDALLALARTDPDARIRSEASYHYIRAAGQSGVANLVALIEQEPEVSVKKRAISGLASLDEDAGLPHLISLYRSSGDVTVKKEAISAVSRSEDPRARALLEEIIRR